MADRAQCLNQASSTSDGPLVLSYAVMPGPRLWPWATCGGILFVSFVLQALFLPCLCRAGTVKMNIAMALDLAFVARFILARLLGQRNRDWRVWGVVLLSSGVWIEWVVESETARSFVAALGLGL